MARYKTSRTLPAVLTVVIIIVAIAGIVGLARLIFTGSAPSTDTKAEVDIIQQALLNTKDGRSVSMTVRGPIVADEDFRSYRITISPTARNIQAYTGYLETVTSEETLPNNTAAYEEFVNALDKANLVAGKPFEEERNNLSGICAGGRVYEFAIRSGTVTEHMYWTSTCGGSRGSLKANVNQLSKLFLDQVPSGSDIARSLRL